MRRLRVNPQLVSRQLFEPLADCHGAQRGTYRIDYPWFIHGNWG